MTSLRIKNQVFFNSVVIARTPLCEGIESFVILDVTRDNRLFKSIITKVVKGLPGSTLALGRDGEKPRRVYGAMFSGTSGREREKITAYIRSLGVQVQGIEISLNATGSDEDPTLDDVVVRFLRRFNSIRFVNSTTGAQHTGRVA